MAFQPRISTLDGANLFWERYGITICENDGIYYASGRGADDLHSTTLKTMWEKLGDRFIQVSAP